MKHILGSSEDKSKSKIVTDEYLHKLRGNLLLLVEILLSKRIAWLLPLGQKPYLYNGLLSNASGDIQTQELFFLTNIQSPPFDLLKISSYWVCSLVIK